MCLIFIDKFRNQSEVGDASKSITRSLQAKRYTFTPEIINTVSQFPKRNDVKLSSAPDPDREYCINANYTKSFTVKLYSYDSSAMHIIEGTNPDPDVTWSVEGIESNAGSITSNGEFTAYDTVLTTWYCYILATRPYNGTTIKDSVPVIINPTISSSYDCDPDTLVINKFAGLQYTPSFDILGASADITTKFGLLCTSDTSFFAASLSRVAVVKDINTNPNDNHIWAEAGVVRRKFIGYVGYFDVPFYEFQYDLPYDKYDRIIRYMDAPYSDTSVASIKLELDILGKWNYYIDGKHYQLDDPASIWPQNYGGNRVLYGGEILNTHDDMPGLLNDKNTLSNCQIFSDTSVNFINTDFSLAWPITAFDTTDISKWMIDITGNNSIQTWDVNPH